MRLDEQSLTKEQYNEIKNRIWQHHRFAHGGRNIKYIRPSWDMRDGRCFHIEFNNHIHFDYQDEGGTMFDKIMAWLKEREVEVSSTKTCPDCQELFGSFFLDQEKCLGCLITEDPTEPEPPLNVYIHHPAQEGRTYILNQIECVECRDVFQPITPGDSVCHTCFDKTQRMVRDMNWYSHLEKENK